MAEYVLENEELRAVISDHGAELRSLTKKEDGREMMWCGDAAYWGRVSPILFPVVGAYRNKESRYQGKTYRMGQHGFARDKDFVLEEQSEQKICFSLTMSKEEAEENGYPFAFRLELGYELSGRSVKVLWTVRNTGDERMYYSIGGHPAFAASARENGKTTCYLQFRDVDHLKVRTLEGGLASDRIVEIPLGEDGILPVTEELFAGDALVIENNQTQEAALLDHNKVPFLTVRFSTPLFGVWTPPGKNAPFICIEPWYGRCDGVGFEGNLDEREWGNDLAPGDFFASMYSIRV